MDRLKSVVVITRRDFNEILDPRMKRPPQGVAQGHSAYRSRHQSDLNDESASIELATAIFNRAGTLASVRGYLGDETDLGYCRNWITGMDSTPPNHSQISLKLTPLRFSTPTMSESEQASTKAKSPAQFERC